MKGVSRTEKEGGKMLSDGMLVSEHPFRFRLSNPDHIRTWYPFIYLCELGTEAMYMA